MLNAEGVSVFWQTFQLPFLELEIFGRGLHSCYITLALGSVSEVKPNVRDI